MPLLYQVDAFTGKPFSGNQAAVCLLDSQLSDEIYQNIAAEMNLSETAFVYPIDDNTWETANRFSLRWFTPKIEVPLCGHATLATAKVLFDELKNQNIELEFETRWSGVLKARKNDEHDLILMDFPINEPEEIEFQIDLSEILGYKTLIRSLYNPTIHYLLLHIADEQTLIELEPDYTKLMEQKLFNKLIGIIVTTEGSGKFDFMSRFFAPWVGVPEDPVTGSAHTVLYPYWSKLLKRSELHAYQASPRGGEVRLWPLGRDRVLLGGKAVVVLKGELRI